MKKLPGTFILYNSKYQWSRKVLKVIKHSFFIMLYISRCTVVYTASASKVYEILFEPLRIVNY